jgi:hypothetical protein
MTHSKKILVFIGIFLINILFCGNNILFAQTPLPQVEYSEDYRNKINHVFENLNLKYVPSGLLSDYAFSFCSIDFSL